MYVHILENFLRGGGIATQVKRTAHFCSLLVILQITMVYHHSYALSRR